MFFSTFIVPNGFLRLFAPINILISAVFDMFSALTFPSASMSFFDFLKPAVSYIVTGIPFISSF